MEQNITKKMIYVKKQGLELQLHLRIVLCEFIFVDVRLKEILLKAFKEYHKITSLFM